MIEEPITPGAAIQFLHEAAQYFERRPTKGEDAAHWSNVANASNCRRIARLISTTPTPRDQGEAA